MPVITDRETRNETQMNDHETKQIDRGQETREYIEPAPQKGAEPVKHAKETNKPDRSRK